MVCFSFFFESPTEISVVGRHGHSAQAISSACRIRSASVRPSSRPPVPNRKDERSHRSCSTANRHNPTRATVTHTGTNGGQLDGTGGGQIRWAMPQMHPLCRAAAAVGLALTYAVAVLCPLLSLSTAAESLDHLPSHPLRSFCHRRRRRRLLPFPLSPSCFFRHGLLLVHVHLHLSALLHPTAT